MIDGRCIGGRYELEHRLGQGAMGEVWVARDVRLDARRALKLQKSAAGDVAAGQRFELEARAMARLRSPHLVHVYDYGEDEGRRFIVMDLLEGESLKARLGSVLRLGPWDVVAIVEQAARALGVVHRHGLVHRDVKPSNLFLAHNLAEDARETLVLLDFGIAKLLEGADAPSPTSAGTVVGSPGYLSPEQAFGSRLDARSDLWSLAVVAYRALTGREPFSAPTLDETIARTCSGRFAPPSQLGSQWRAFDAVFARAFAVDRELRFAAPGAFAAALRWAAERAAPALAQGDIVRAELTSSLSAPARQRERWGLARGRVVAGVATAFALLVAVEVMRGSRTRPTEVARAAPPVAARPPIEPAPSPDPPASGVSSAPSREPTLAAPAPGPSLALRAARLDSERPAPIPPRARPAPDSPAELVLDGMFGLPVRKSPGDADDAPPTPAPRVAGLPVAEPAGARARHGAAARQ